MDGKIVFIIHWTLAFSFTLVGAAPDQWTLYTRNPNNRVRTKPPSARASAGSRGMRPWTLGSENRYASWMIWDKSGILVSIGMKFRNAGWFVATPYMIAVWSGWITKIEVVLEGRSYQRVNHPIHPSYPIYLRQPWAQEACWNPIGSSMYRVCLRSYHHRQTPKHQ